MQAEKLRDIIADCCNDVIFVYNGKRSGITAEIHNYTPVFYLWHGDSTKELSNIDDTLHDPFFSGKSLYDLLEIVESQIL